MSTLDPDPDFAPTVDADIVSVRATFKPQRLLSIDVLRGLTIAFMIIVNNQTGPAPFHELTHAAWNGLTATDLVFPTFLFLVGLTTVLSTVARAARGASHRELFLHALRRSLLLILFGFIVNNFPFFHLATARYYGVLPRIGVCYFFVASLFLLSKGWKDKLVIVITCLVAYWALMRFVPVPGYGVPTHDIVINDHDGNLAAWLDRQIFSAKHLYEHTRDPEGLLSTLPSIATAMFGMLAGMWLRTQNSTVRKARGLPLAGVGLIAIGTAWNPWFPVNKKLWTSSYVLAAAGISTVLLGAAVAIIDLWRVGRSKTESNDSTDPNHPALYRPLLVLGTNAILAYIISELMQPLLRLIHLPSGVSLGFAITHGVLNAVPSPAWASLLYSLLYLLVCWLLVYPLYCKRIFLRI